MFPILYLLNITITKLRPNYMMGTKIDFRMEDGTLCLTVSLKIMVFAFKIIINYFNNYYINLLHCPSIF